jgi:hypothetical protein
MLGLCRACNVDLRGWPQHVRCATAMEAIQEAKQAADQAFRQQQYQQAILKYGDALQASEDSLIADLLHVLYSNRCRRKQGFPTSPRSCSVYLQTSRNSSHMELYRVPCVITG